MKDHSEMRYDVEFLERRKRVRKEKECGELER